MRHKHADVIKAWAEGAKIQLYQIGMDDWVDTPTPLWFEVTQYRVKPEPKPDVVVRYGAKLRGGLYVEPWGNPNLKLTFDGETGELKAAEVLK